MDRKLSITERLAGSIRLDDQKLIDEIIESEIWDYDEDLECMEGWPSDSEKEAPDEAIMSRNEEREGMRAQRMCWRRSGTLPGSSLNSYLILASRW